jgi:phosphoglycerol transferase MdoB-like AlkP superfamily enzyme
MKVITKQILVTIITSLVSFFLIEIIYRGGTSEFFKWAANYPRQALYFFLFLFLLNGALLILNYKGFFLATVIVNILFCFLAFASYVKEKLRGDPLLPTEILLVDEARNMLNYFSNLSIVVIAGMIFITLLFIAIVTIAFIKIKNSKAYMPFYTTAGIFLLISAVFLYQDVNTKDSFIKKIFDIQVNLFDQKENYHTNGVVLSFIRNVKGVVGEEPNQYSKESITEIVKGIKKGQATKVQEKPDIIFIQGEAFWDPTVVDTVSFNKDPLPFFHQLSKSSTYGNLHVPVFGGNTVNTEFEVLTGMTNQFLPNGSIPYKHYLKKPLPALPHLLRNQGYQATAIHPYHNWFYERDNVFNYLGFDNFVSVEFFPNPVQDMYYYRDNEITDEIIKKLEEDEKPNFIYAITMQNHGPYRTDAKKFYASMDVKSNIPNQELSSDAKKLLEFQTDNLVEMDKELKRLIKYLQKSKRKAIVVYFGDHLPLLGDNYLVYKETGYFQNDQTFDQYVKMYQTPLLIWNNYDYPTEQLDISAPFLASYVLDMAGLNGYYFTDFLNDLRKEGKAFLPRLDYLKHSKLEKADIEKYKLLQYDLLFGEKYGLAINKVPYEPSKTYRLGYGDPKIKNAKITTYKNGKKAVLLKGEYFTTGTQIYINGEPVESTFQNDRTVYAFIPEGVKPKEIVMKIYDSQNTLLAESNKVTKIQ